MRSGTLIKRIIAALAAAALVFLPAALARCGSDTGDGSGTGAGTDGNSGTGTAAAVTDNPFSSVDEYTTYSYGFLLATPGPEEDMVYDGSPVEAEYSINNGSAEMSVGMLMFVNGLPQPYSVGDGDAEYMHVETVPKEESISVRIKFTPVCGAAGDRLTLQFLSVLNPQTRPDKPNFIFGHANRMMSIFPRKLEMKCDAPETPADLPRLDPARDMTDDEVAEFIYTDRDGREISALDTFTVKVRDPEHAEQAYLSAAGGALSFAIEAYGGTAQEYTVVPFINGVPLTDGGFPAVLTIPEGTKIFEGTFSVDLGKLDGEKYSLEEFNTFYVVAVPVGGGVRDYPITSSSLVFEK